MLLLLLLLTTRQLWTHRCASAVSNPMIEGISPVSWFELRSLHSVGCSQSPTVIQAAGECEVLHSCDSQIGVTCNNAVPFKTQAVGKITAATRWPLIQVTTAPAAFLFPATISTCYMSTGWVKAETRGARLPPVDLKNVHNALPCNESVACAH